MKHVLKRAVARFPYGLRQELRRLYLRHQIRRGRFTADEPEFAILPSFIRPGHWVIDVGANVGHYACAMSDLVGPNGRVFALEPVPATFELLAANVARLRFTNVTLLCLAASDRCAEGAMTIPRASTGLENYYLAHLDGQRSDVQVLCLAIDQLALPAPVRLVKVDAEGCEERALRGMSRLLERDQPILIVENSSPSAMGFLKEMGYIVRRLPGSPNVLLRHVDRLEADPENSY